MRSNALIFGVSLLVAVLTGSVVAGSASATPGASTADSSGPVAAPDGSRITSVVMQTPTRAKVQVYSVAMRRSIPVSVLLPRDRSQPRPTLYLLDGIDGGEYTNYTESGWTEHSDVVRFMADKQVNVVMPIGGTASYYTDWLSRDPVLGRNKWESFLAKELPPLIDARFNGNGNNVIGGLSMGALGATSIAVRHPELYTGVASFSGCLDQSTPELRQATAGTIISRGGNPDNMWGPVQSPIWSAHDPSEQVSALRGKKIFVSVGNGLPDPALGIAGISTPAGGAIEGIALQCTHRFRAKAERAGVHATYYYHPGVHAWGYWNRDLHRSWPTIASAMKVPV